MDTQPKQNKMGVMPVTKLLFNMSLPIMISMFIQAMYNIVDSIYVARFSKHALTAITLAFPVQMLFSAVTIGTCVGISSLVSRRLGARRNDEADSAAANGIVLVLLGAAAFTAFGLFFVNQYFSAVVSVNSDPQVAAYGFDYLSVVMRMCFGVAMAICFEKLLQSTGKTLLSMITQATGALINIFLDPVLIFGYCGFEAMGARGAAIATVVGQLASMVIGLIFILFCNPELRIRIRNFPLQKQTVGEIYRVGLPSIVMQSVGSLANFLLNKILIAYSDIAVAVLGVYYKLNSFALMPMFGLNSGIIPIVGYNYGAHNKQRIIKAVKSGLLIGLGIMTVGIAVFMLIPDKLLTLFDADAQMLAIGIPAFRIACSCFLFAAGSIVLSGCFSGLGLGHLSLINALIRNIVILIPVAYILSASFGLDAIWWAFPISEAVSLAGAVFMFFGAKKKYIDVIETAK